MMQVKQISDNEIYLLIKYIKSVLWRVVKRLSYIEDARCLKVKCMSVCNTVVGFVVAYKHLELVLIHFGSVPELLDILLSASDHN